MNTTKLFAAKVAAKAAIAVAMGAAATAHGTTGVWTNTAASGNWADAKNWENAYVPTNAGDSASFPADVEITNSQQNPIREITMPDIDMTNDVISGTAGNTLVGQQLPRTFSFNDAADFAGTFKLDYPHTLSFRATAAHTPVAQRIYANGRPIVNIPDADGTLEATSIYGNALFDKSGAGTLRIVNGGGAQTRLRIREASTVELVGEPSDMDVDTLDGIPTPSLWLDASIAASITTNAEGKVTKWADKRDAVAGTSSYRYLTQPLAGDPPSVAEKAVNGLDVVDFGAINYTALNLDYAMKLNRHFDDSEAVELFIAYENNSPTNHAVLWGDTDAKKYNFAQVSGNDVALFANDSGPRVRNGEVRLDGERIWWNETRHPRGGFHVLSISNSGTGSRLNSLGFQRGVGIGGAKVGEAIVFGSHLTADQRRRVIRYLQKKWCNGDNARSWELGGVELVENATLSVPAGRRARVAKISTSTGKMLSVAGGGVLETSLIGTPPKGARSNSGSTTVAWNTAEPMPVSISSGATLRLVPGVTANAEAALPADPYAHFDATEASTIIAENGAVSEWRDVRSGSTIKAGASNSPEVLDNAMNGKPVISTKALYSDKSSASFKLYSGDMEVARGAKNCREAFVAGRARRAGDGWGYAMFLGSWGDRSFTPAGYGRLITGEYVGSLFSQGFTPAQIDNYIALDGVPVDPANYVMTTNWVVLSTSFRTSQIWTTLARYGENFTGGIDYGEVIVYNRSLTPEERRNVEAYLLKKWRGIDVHPENAPSKTGTLSLASGATLALAEGAGLAAQGGISVADGATIALELGAPNGTAPLTATGTASFTGAATIKVDFDGEYGTYPLVSADAVSGSLSSISLQLPASAKDKASLLLSGGNVVLKYSPTATVISMR